MELRTILTLAAIIPLAAAVVILLRAYRSNATHSSAIATGDEHTAQRSRRETINRLSWVTALLLATAALLLAGNRL